MKNKVFKIFVIGLITTFSRIIGQLLIPPGEQSILAPSIFASSGTMPLVFSVYSIIAYSSLAAMFLLLVDQLSGTKIWQGLQYGIACSLIWFVYLLEPLPHAAPLDRITYPLADTASLLVLGALTGLWLGRGSMEKRSGKTSRIRFSRLVPITILFLTGRLFQYLVIDIYSSFSTSPWTSIAWSVLTGLVIAVVMNWFAIHLGHYSPGAKVLVQGGLLFGINLTFFNFYMPLIFQVDLVDLMMRTGVDILTISLGVWLLDQSLKKISPKFDQDLKTSS